MVTAIFTFPGCSEDSPDGGTSSGDDDEDVADDDAAATDDDLDDDASDDEVDDDLDDDAADDDAGPPLTGLLSVDGGYFDTAAAGLVADGDGVFHAVATHARTLYHYTIDGDTVTREALAFRATDPDLAIAADGALHMAFADQVAGAIDYMTNAGGSWSRETVTPIELYDFGDLNIALGADGAPHIVVAQRSLIYAARQADGTWNATEFPDTGYVRQADVAIDAAGRPHVVFSAMSSDVYVDHMMWDGNAWITSRLAEHDDETYAAGIYFTTWDYMGVAVAADDENVYATYALDEFETDFPMFEFAADVHLATIDAEGNVATEQFDRSDDMFVMNASLAAGDFGVRAAYGLEAIPIWIPIPSSIRYWNGQDPPVTAAHPTA